jgi:translation elongation factor EF-Ts
VNVERVSAIAAHLRKMLRRETANLPLSLQCAFAMAAIIALEHANGDALKAAQILEDLGRASAQDVRDGLIRMASKLEEASP